MLWRRSIAGVRNLDSHCRLTEPLSMSPDSSTRLSESETHGDWRRSVEPEHPCSTPHGAFGCCNSHECDPMKLASRQIGTAPRDTSAIAPSCDEIVPPCLAFRDDRFR